MALGPCNLGRFEIMPEISLAISSKRDPVFAQDLNVVLSMVHDEISVKRENVGHQVCSHSIAPSRAESQLISCVSVCAEDEEAISCRGSGLYK